MSDRTTSDDPEATAPDDGLEDVLMSVKGLMLDPGSNIPIVVLRDESGDKMLPIWIGTFEANAIAMRLERKRAPRPLTHDLFASSFAVLEIHLERVLICDLRDNTFFARLSVAHAGGQVQVDARPSDAIALALRLDAPIYVTQDVLEKAHLPESQEAVPDEKKIREWLEQADSDDFGEYEM